MFSAKKSQNLKYEFRPIVQHGCLELRELDSVHGLEPIYHNLQQTLIGDPDSGKTEDWLIAKVGREIAIREIPGIATLVDELVHRRHLQNSLERRKSRTT